MRGVQEGCREWMDLGWIMIMAGSTENVIDGERLEEVKDISDIMNALSE